MLPIVSMPSWTLPDVEGEREGDGTGWRGDKGKNGGVEGKGGEGNGEGRRRT